ncbi:MAG: hybrid sensor histidine kinase/response regulator [Verrucomicrobiia bacterium]|jgi:signal transduction histidine kinase
MEQITSEVHQKTPDILIVDDTPANLQLLTEMLKKHGYRVRPVPSGKLAIQAVQNEKPDLILLDINMPEMNGYEVCEHFKADEALKEIPVLFISALDETIDKIKAFAAGGVDYVTKPFQFEEVEARVQTHLKLRRLQIELESRNRQLQENYDQLRKLEDLRDNLTHMIVHDMRSPLMGITGYLEMLEMDAGKKLNSDELAILRDARSSGLVLVGMVNSLLDISRLEQGKMPLNVTESDVDVLIQNALNSLGSLTKQVSLLYQKQSLPVMVNCDANLVTRVIANLVGNAIKFTPEGGKVAVSVEKNGDGAKLCVADTGSGIPREYHEKIFEKFGQVEAQQQGKMYSTGLGLTFCKLAVEAHGGEIGVESEVDKGSTFWFTLPA